MNRKRPTVRELEEILEKEEDTPIEILPNGEIRALGQGQHELGGRKPLTLRENLGGEYATTMDLARVGRDVRHARAHFPNLESWPSLDGGVYVLMAMQTSQGEIYTLQIDFPHYPNQAPEVRVRLPGLKPGTPHKYPGNQICYVHPKMWNPGRHNLTFVLARTAKWLHKYEVWSRSYRWPGAGHRH